MTEAETQDETICHLIAQDTRRALALAGFTTTDHGRNWTRDDFQVTLAEAMEAFMRNPELGEARMESIRKRAEALRA